MPPVSQQGSRAALLTWSVVTGMLAVVATFFAIYFYVENSKTTLKLDDKIKSYNEIISPGDLSGQEVADLKTLRTAEKSPFQPNTPVFNVLMAQRDALAKLVGGAAAKETTAQTSAEKALAAAAAIAKDAKVTIPTADNLSGAVTALANALKSMKSRADGLQADLTQTKQQMAADVKSFEAARAEMAKSLAAVREQQKKAVDEVAGYQQTKDASVAEIEKAREGERAAAQKSLDEARVQITSKDQQIAKLQQDLETVRTKYMSNRVNTEDAVTRQADGKIIRIPAGDVVYINLGSQDSLTPGLSFEVYDKFEGIPPAGDPATDEKLPKGKASIEVTRVGTNSSECRVVRRTVGTQITEGDLIANLVYDPNVKYNFMVYGDFDIDQNGNATPQEADTIKRLISQWGGKLIDQVNVDTDFVILGKEPVLPNFTKEDLQDPFNAKKLTDAQAALDSYQAVKKQATDLHIPVLNQNRFLYLIGYYSQAKR